MSRVFSGAAGAGLAIMLGLTSSPAGAVTTRATMTIEPAVGASVVLNILSQTNLMVSLVNTGQAAASIRVPASLGGVGSGVGADVGLPTVITALGGGGPGLPNGVAMSVGGSGAGGGPSGRGQGDGTALVVIQYN